MIIIDRDAILALRFKRNPIKIKRPVAKIPPGASDGNYRKTGRLGSNRLAEFINRLVDPGADRLERLIRRLQ